MGQDRCALLEGADEAACAAKAARKALADERAWWMRERRRVFGEVREGLRPESDADEIEADWTAWAEAYPDRLNRIEDEARAARRRAEAQRQRERVRRFIGAYAPPEVRHYPPSVQAVFCAVSRECARSADGTAEIANGQIEGATGLSTASVKRGTRQLAAEGLFAKVERRVGRYNLPNVYRVAKASLLAWARKAFGVRCVRMRGGVSSEPESRKGFSPVPTHPAHERDDSARFEDDEGRSEAGGKVGSGGEGRAQSYEGAPRGAVKAAEGSEGTGRPEGGSAPSPAPARGQQAHQVGEHGAAEGPAGAWTPTAADEAEALDRLARMALEEAGHALTGSASRGAVTRAVDRLRREKLDRFEEAEWQRLRAVHGRKADLAVLEVVLLTEVREGTTSSAQPAPYRKEIRDPVRYLHGILARRRSACRPEVTLGRLLAHRRRSLPYPVQLAVWRHDRERGAKRAGLAGLFETQRRAA